MLAVTAASRRSLAPGPGSAPKRSFKNGLMASARRNAASAARGSPLAMRMRPRPASAPKCLGSSASDAVDVGERAVVLAQQIETGWRACSSPRPNQAPGRRCRRGAASPAPAGLAHEIDGLLHELRPSRAGPTAATASRSPPPSRRPPPRRWRPRGGQTARRGAGRAAPRRRLERRGGEGDWAVAAPIESPAIRSTRRQAAAGREGQCDAHE